MKKMFMMMLLSIVSWTGAVTATEATAPLKSNGPVAQQEAVVAADTPVSYTHLTLPTTERV